MKETSSHKYSPPRKLNQTMKLQQKLKQIQQFNSKPSIAKVHSPPMIPLSTSNTYVQTNHTGKIKTIHYH